MPNLEWFVYTLFSPREWCYSLVLGSNSRPRSGVWFLVIAQIGADTEESTATAAEPEGGRMQGQLAQGTFASSNDYFVYRNVPVTLLQAPFFSELICRRMLDADHYPVAVMDPNHETFRGHVSRHGHERVCLLTERSSLVCLSHLHVKFLDPRFSCKPAAHGRVTPTLARGLWYRVRLPADSLHNRVVPFPCHVLFGCPVGCHAQQTT